jgi:hypothetical protein
MDVCLGRHIEFDQLVDQLVYRVHFWSVTAGSAPNLEAHVLRGATDVREVVDWAERNSFGRPWELFALIEVLRSLEADPEDWWVRLSGRSPLEPA